MTDKVDVLQQPLSLKSRITQDGVVVVPGVYDALTASLAASAGFDALYLSGAAIAYTSGPNPTLESEPPPGTSANSAEAEGSKRQILSTRLGRPDIGLMSSTEVADALAHVSERVETPTIVDADTGYGNALNVERTVRLFERAGAAAIQLEDQTFPMRCGHLEGKGIVAMYEMVGRIHAAVDARRRTQTLIIARTDAIAVEGFESAIQRAECYADAGADILFVEAPRTREQLSAVARALGARAPLLANMVEGGKTPILSGAELEALGFRLVIFPGAIVRALARAARDFYGVLRRDGTTDAFRDRMFDFEALNDILGTADMLARGRAYEGGDRTKGSTR
jgi:2-methylisocitrate lyase-like PEP mutase family enzyme